MVVVVAVVVHLSCHWFRKHCLLDIKTFPTFNFISALDSHFFFLFIYEPFNIFNTFSVKIICIMANPLHVVSMTMFMILQVENKKNVLVEVRIL